MDLQMRILLFFQLCDNSDEQVKSGFNSDDLHHKRAGVVAER